MYPDCKFCIYGDYNADTDWSNDELGVSLFNPDFESPASIISCTFGFLNLFQMNSVPNSRGAFLDLLFTHFNDVTVEPAEDLLVHNTIHHTACSFELNLMHANDVIDYLKYEY